MKLFNTFFLLAIIIISTVSCTKNNQRFVFSTDRKNRPITECLEMGVDGFFGAAIAMNCQKSVFENILLCSHGRSLEYYQNISDCKKAFIDAKTTNGVYSLATDPDA